MLFTSDLNSCFFTSDLNSCFFTSGLLALAGVPSCLWQTVLLPLSYTLRKILTLEEVPSGLWQAGLPLWSMQEHWSPTLLGQKQRVGRTSTAGTSP